MRKLIVGLGNPGKEYEKTPHNVGFSLLEALAEAENLVAPQKKWKSLSWSYWHNEVKVVLLLPQTYMNLSGDAVAMCLRDHEIEDASDLLVVHDEVDFDLGDFKYKLGGGEAGHKGLKSISQRLATQEYARLRMGVGPKRDGNLSDFVLKRFSKEANDVILSRFPLILESLAFWIDRGTPEAMNRFNGNENKSEE